jgi:hypothetical protein
MSASSDTARSERTQHGEDTGQDDQGTGGKERGIAFQVADHTRVGDAVVAQQHAAHPVFAVQVQHTGQARCIPSLPRGITGVAAPAQDEPERGKQVDLIGFDERHAGPYDERGQCGSWLACDGVCSVTAELTGTPLSQASQLPH